MASDTTQTMREKFRSVSGTHYGNYFGATAGFSTAVGVSYRRWFNEQIAVQLTVGPFFTQEENDKGEDKLLFVGLTGYKSFLKGNYIRFLGYTSAHYTYADSWWDYYSTSYSSDSLIHRKGTSGGKSLAIGAGAGIEGYIGHLALNLMIGLAPRFSKANGDIWRWGLIVSPECGVYVRF